MKKFDENYVLLSDMRHDEYFPEFLVDEDELQEMAEQCSALRKELYE